MFSLFKKIKKHLSSFFVNRRIKQYKYIHIMFNDKFNSPFVKFLNKEFNNEEHLILCKRFFKEFPFPKGKNVVEIDSLKGLDFSCTNKIICHSLFDSELVDYLYSHRELLTQKAYWVVWGGDLYNATRNKKNDWVRSNFRGYLLFADKDSDILKSKYENILHENFHSIEYPLCLDITKIKSTLKKNDEIIIQINNSCDKTTLEMLDVLAKYKNENIKIVTVLSYGDLKYKADIIHKGTELYGDNFSYFDNYVSPEEYARHIANIDIFIANQNRQQATANIDMCLFFNTKVFIRSEISTYDMYQKMGYCVYDTNEIKKLSYDDFIYKLDNDNTKLARYYISNEYRKKLWETCFNEK